MYLIITLLLLLPIAECRAGEIVEICFLSPKVKGYEKDGLRVWRDEKGSFAGFNRNVPPPMYVEVFGPVLETERAKQLFHQFEKELSVQKQKEHEREAEERVEREEQGKILKVHQNERREQTLPLAKTWSLGRLFLST